MKSKINIQINNQVVTSKDSTNLRDFKRHIVNLNLTRHEGEKMRKEIRAITNTYINLIPKRIKEKVPTVDGPIESGPILETITIPRHEYDDMKATIVAQSQQLAIQSQQITTLMREVQELREENQKLRTEVSELRNVCEKYFATYGPLPN